MFWLILPVLADVVSGEFEPDPEVLSSLNISLVTAPNLTLAEVFGDIFSDVTDFDDFNVMDNVDVLASGFVWSESPVYVSNKNLQGVIFSDVKEENLGRTYYWDELTGETSILLDNSGIIGSQDNDWLIKFRNFQEWLELGANGMITNKNDKHLYMAQHGNRQIIKFKFEDIDRENNYIDSCDVEVIIDNYNGTSLNSPNDMCLSKNGAILYFSDPPYGLQRSDDSEISDFFNQRDLDFSGVYQFNMKTDVLTLIDDTMPGPNGIGITNDDRYLLVGNTLNMSGVDPFWRLYDLKNDYYSYIDIKFDDSMWDILVDFELVDGLVYFGNNLFVATGPSGVYIIDINTASILGRITIGDLVSNIEFKYPYLYLTANANLLRIRLADV